MPSDNTFLKVNSFNKYNLRESLSPHLHAGDSLTHQGLRVDLHQTIIHAHFIFHSHVWRVIRLGVGVIDLEDVHDLLSMQIRELLQYLMSSYFSFQTFT